MAENQQTSNELSFAGLVNYQVRTHNLSPKIADRATRLDFNTWMSIGSPSVEGYIKETGNAHLSKQEIIRRLKPPYLPPKATSTTPAKDYSYLRGGLSGKAKEAMAKKSAKVYTITQLQTIVKQLKSFQSHYDLPRSEDIEVRIHPFPKEPGQKAYPIELTLIVEEHFSRSFIDPAGNLQWEQRYDCALTYDTYGSMTEGDDLEGSDDEDPS